MANIFNTLSFPGHIKEAANIIKGGGLVSFPTETVYGLGADALNPIAVTKIFEAKNRPFFDPIIVHISNLTSIEKLTNSYTKTAQKLAERFMPGPLTIVLSKSDIVPDIVTAGLPTVAIRMPSHKVALELIKESETPIAAPSANPFGYISPTKAEHVIEQLGDKIDMILDGGECVIGIESTIIKVDTPEPVILRYGGVPLEEIEEVIGKVKIADIDHEKPHSPGQLPYHYSPRTPVKLIEQIDAIDLKGSRTGVLAFKAPQKSIPHAKVEVLSVKGDLREAAANLFSSLHRLDTAGVDIIYAEAIPEIGLGKAIMDRLRKAAKKS